MGASQKLNQDTLNMEGCEIGFVYFSQKYNGYCVKVTCNPFKVSLPKQDLTEKFRHLQGEIESIWGKQDDLIELYAEALVAKEILPHGGSFETPAGTVSLELDNNTPYLLKSAISKDTKLTLRIHEARFEDGNIQRGLDFLTSLSEEHLIVARQYKCEYSGTPDFLDPVKSELNSIGATGEYTNFEGLVCKFGSSPSYENRKKGGIKIIPKLVTEKVHITEFAIGEKGKLAYVYSKQFPGIAISCSNRNKAWQLVKTRNAKGSKFHIPFYSSVERLAHNALKDKDIMKLTKLTIKTLKR